MESPRGNYQIVFLMEYFATFADITLVYSWLSIARDNLLIKESALTKLPIVTVDHNLPVFSLSSIFFPVQCKQCTYIYILN